MGVIRLRIQAVGITGQEETRELVTICTATGTYGKCEHEGSTKEENNGYVVFKGNVQGSAGK
jgi:hypothetical protein